MGRGAMETGRAEQGRAAGGCGDAVPSLWARNITDWRGAAGQRAEGEGHAADDGESGEADVADGEVGDGTEAADGGGMRAGNEDEGERSASGDVGRSGTEPSHSSCASME